MTSSIDPTTGAQLLTFAEEMLRAVVCSADTPAVPELAILQNEYGAFSTLRRGSALRGCIGNFAGSGPLGEILPRVVRESATQDFRFPPVSCDEVDEISLSLSILFPAYPVDSAEEIRLGRDGAILSLGRRRAVFLPEVAVEQRWDRETMLDALARKAGLFPGAWRDSRARLEVFQTVHISRSTDDASVIIEDGTNA